MKAIFRRLKYISRRSRPNALPGEIFLPALEERWKVIYRKTGSRSVQARCNSNGLLTVTGDIDDSRRVVKGLRRWLIRKARDHLVSWLDELSVSSGLSYGTVAVRGQRTRWASCSSKGNINLNYRLFFLSPEVVRYILNHELCHTVHPDHSRRFWSKVASLEPDYKTLSVIAKRGMEDVPDWAKD